MNNMSMSGTGLLLGAFCFFVVFAPITWYTTKRFRHERSHTMLDELSNSLRDLWSLDNTMYGIQAGAIIACAVCYFTVTSWTESIVFTFVSEVVVLFSFCVSLNNGTKIFSRLTDLYVENAKDKYKQDSLFISDLKHDELRNERTWSILIGIISSVALITMNEIKCTFVLAEPKRSPATVLRDILFGSKSDLFQYNYYVVHGVSCIVTVGVILIILFSKNFPAIVESSVIALSNKRKLDNYKSFIFLTDCSSIHKRLHENLGDSCTIIQVKDSIDKEPMYYSLCKKFYDHRHVGVCYYKHINFSWSSDDLLIPLLIKKAMIDFKCEKDKIIYISTADSDTNAVTLTNYSGKKVIMSYEDMIGITQKESYSSLSSTAFFSNVSKSRVSFSIDPFVLERKAGVIKREWWDEDLLGFRSYNQAESSKSSDTSAFREKAGVIKREWWDEDLLGFRSYNQAENSKFIDTSACREKAGVIEKDVPKRDAAFWFKALG